MSTIQLFNKRILHANPIEPLTWRAEYKNPYGRLNQFEGNAYHYASEIDCSRVARLIIRGHPASPIYCDVIARLGPPDEVLIGAHNFLQVELGLSDIGDGQRGYKDKISIPYFGFRWGEDQYLTEIMPDGAVWKVLIERGIETARGKI